MSWRLDETLLRVFDRLGPGWFVLALAVLGYVVARPIIRAMILGVFLLVSTQSWYGPIYVLSRELRWWVLGIVCIRGVLHVMRIPTRPGEGRMAHRMLFLLGGMALASCFWATSLRYSLEIAGSFVVGLVHSFWVLWRLIYEHDVVAAFARGVTWFALLVFGTGFGVTILSATFGWWDYYEATGWGGRYSGVFYNANMAGLLGAIVLPIVVAAPREYVGRIASFRLLVIALVAATVFFSGSRSAVIGAVFGTIVVWVYRYGTGGFMMLLLGGTTAAALLVFAPPEDLDESAVGHITRTKRIDTLSGRIELWEKGWAASQDSLVYGHGWAESRLLDGGDAELALERGGVVFGSNLHNAHLQLLVDLGFLGVAFFWGFCGVVLVGGMRLVRAPPTARNTLAIVVFASVVAMMADTFVHGSVFSTGSPNTLVFWGFCAIALKEAERVRLERLGLLMPIEWTMPEFVPVPGSLPASLPGSYGGPIRA